MTSVKASVRSVEYTLSSDTAADFALAKIGLSRNSFLLHWMLMNLEQAAANTFKTAHKANSNARRKSSATLKVIATVESALETVCNVLSIINLGRLYNTTSERDLLLGLFLKPVYTFMESESIMKTTSLRMYLFKCICLAVRNHHQQANVQTSVMQLLIYFDHLPENLAELLQILYEQYDHSHLTEEVLKEVSSRDFNANDTKGPKLVSVFLIRLSGIAPRLLLKQFSMVARFLDSDSFTLRCAIIEATGNVLTDVSTTEEDLERHSSQIESLFDLLEERVLDINPFCRCRALQALTNIAGLDYKFTKRRPHITELAVQGTKDKSSFVRRNALKLLSKLISTHPFGLLHGSQLTLKEWEKRRDMIQSELDQVLPPPENPAQTDADDVDMLDEPTKIPEEDEEGEEEQDEESEAKRRMAAGGNSEIINKLQLTKKYYTEAITFITKVHEGMASAQQLLNSKNKSEIIESMDLFVLADAYGIEVARHGIRAMIHLVWAKGNNDEAQAIQTHLIDCYKQLFFDAPADVSQAEANMLVARSLISLTYGATLAEITSLERLLCLAMVPTKEDRLPLISSGVVSTLWKVYGYSAKEFSRSQRRGAIIILGMLARADHEIALAGIDHLVKIGLGEQGKQDFALAKYSCIALQHMVPENEWKDSKRKKDVSPSTKQFPANHEVIQRLAALIMMSSSSIEWLGVAEQAINAVYYICESPDEVMSTLVRVKTTQVFFNEDPITNGDAALSQLLFIVGHVALKTIVYLERCELQFKRSKVESEKSKGEKKGGAAAKKNDDGDDNDMEMIGGGTSEDDFTEAVAYIREREMLYGENSILAKFGPMVSALGRDILDGRRSKLINITGMLCLAKFMCVSARYCEDNLPILMTMLDRFSDPTIRSNAVLALGDIAVSFNHIMDDNTEFLYRRLHDQTPMVQRTCLMTLTFLILAGQVKVKEQLGEMAKCLEDPDRRIADLARMFFLELSTKDNAIYNSFIDMFSALSADENLEGTAFKSIFKFLTPLVDKERYVKQLADKLHARLLRCDAKPQWDATAYVLNLFPHKNDEFTKTVAEGFKKVPVLVE